MKTPKTPKTIDLADRTTIECLVDEMKAFLIQHEDSWPMLIASMDGLSQYILSSFCYGWCGRYQNCRLNTLCQFERACRIIDPTFLAVTTDDMGDYFMYGEENA